MSDYRYEDAVKQLQESGAIGLVDLKSLSHEDLVELLEEIKVCAYTQVARLISFPRNLKRKRRKINPEGVCA